MWIVRYTDTITIMETDTPNGMGPSVHAKVSTFRKQPILNCSNVCFVKTQQNVKRFLNVARQLHIEDFLRSSIKRQHEYKRNGKLIMSFPN